MNIKMNNINIIKYFSITLVILALASCRKESLEEHQHEEHEGEAHVAFTQEQFNTEGVQLGVIEEKQISGTIRVNGVLDVPPQQLISVSAPLGGFLKNTQLLQGSRV